jgi:hypothetical protein
MKFNTLNEMEYQEKKLMTATTGEIILYQPDASVKIDVRIENETVWLNRQQISSLFDRDIKTIGKHINNALKEELLGIPTVAKFATVQTEGNRQVIRNIDFYNLDMILSVGYRIKSQRGVQFRQWANKVLKDYLLRGYAINSRIDRLEKKVTEHDEKIDFFIRTSLPPVEGIFYDGQIYDAFHFVSDLIRSAKKAIRLIDNYVDDSVLNLMSSKQSGVIISIYTKSVSSQLQLAVDKFNAQYGGLTISKFTISHDRFLIIDDTELYLIGASLKDLGKKWFAFSKLDAGTIPDFSKRLK